MEINQNPDPTELFNSRFLLLYVCMFLGDKFSCCYLAPCSVLLLFLTSTTVHQTVHLFSLGQMYLNSSDVF